MPERDQTDVALRKTNLVTFFQLQLPNLSNAELGLALTMLSREIQRRLEPLDVMGEGDEQEEAA